MRRIVFLLYVLVAACHRGAGGAADDQDMTAPEQHPDEHAGVAAEQAMGGAGMVSNEDLHMRLTPERRLAPGDSARAADVLAVKAPQPSKDLRRRGAHADRLPDLI